jgi:hypothetical protein
VNGTISPAAYWVCEHAAVATPTAAPTKHEFAEVGAVRGGGTDNIAFLLGQAAANAANAQARG